MRTDHIAGLSQALIHSRDAAGGDLDRREEELDRARATLGAVDEAIRAYEREIERLKGFRTLALEHVQTIEFDVERLRQFREGCDGILIEATAAPAPDPEPEPAPRPGNGRPNRLMARLAAQGLNGARREPAVGGERQ